jgi:hypothetical protein
MLQAPLENISRSRKSVVQNMPPPVAGWVDAESELSSSLGHALILENFVPTRNSVKLRNGCALAAQLPSSVKSLMEYSSGATEKLVGSTADTLYEVFPDLSIPAKQYKNTPLALTPPAVLATGFDNGDWSHVTFTNAADEVRLIMVNGADGIQTYDGTAVTVTTPTPDIKTLTTVTSFKGRLWFTDKGSSVLHYGDVLSNQPATLTPFPVGPFLKKGGELVAVATWSRDGGSGPDDLLIAVSSNGEIVVFSGIDPADDFALVGVFQGNRPVSKYCFKNIGTDLILYSEYGPQVLTDIFTDSVNVNPMFSNVRESFIKNAITNVGSEGWRFMSMVSDSWTIFNVPVLPPTEMHQYVMNADTGAWFKIKGWNALCFASFQNFDVFGDNAGNIMIMNYGQSDNGNQIAADFMSTWTDLGKSENKKYNMVQATLKSDVVPDIAVDIMTDYRVVEPQTSPGFSDGAVVSPWNTSPWNVSPWSGAIVYYTEWFGLSGIGSVGALRYRLLAKNVYHEFISYRLAAEVGGFL